MVHILSIMNNFDNHNFTFSVVKISKIKKNSCRINNRGQPAQITITLYGRKNQKIHTHRV